MIDLKLIDECIVSVDDSLTFAGIVSTYFDEMCIDNYWKSEEHTQKPYLSDYVKRIIPCINNHDEKSIENYSYWDCRIIIDTMSIQGYSPERIMHFMRLIDAVFRMAHKKLGIVNVLWGTSFELPPEINAEEKIKELVKLKKSLTPIQEKSLYDLLTQNIEISGEYLGVYLMLVFGLRDGEACGLIWGDIIDSYRNNDIKVLLIYKTIESKEHKLISSGKTKNADRIIPIPNKAYEFLIKRKMHIMNILGIDESLIKSYPIVCMNNNYMQFCTPDKINNAARTMFERIGIKAEILSYIDYELINSDSSYILKEKEPTSYMLRRNFATQLAIIGMNESEIQFLLGHDVTNTYETRNEMTDINALISMKNKMNQRALFHSGKEFIKYIYNGDNILSNYYCFTKTNFKIDVNEEDTIKMSLTSCEPGSIIKTEITGSCFDKNIISEHILSEPRYSEDRTINILSDYHRSYRL